MDTDRHMIQEFQALQALSDPHQKPSLKIQQSEAQKEATRMLRAKFRYPAKDPAPNAFKDTRTELEKLQSILRTTSQILDKDQLEIWNTVTERNLHLSRQHNSGIPLLKQNITDQIKAYRLNKEHQDQLIKQVETFDKLYVREPKIENAEDASIQDPEPETSTMQEPLNMDTTKDVIEETAFLATNLALPSPIVISLKLEILWRELDQLGCKQPLVYIFGLNPKLLFASIHHLMPYLVNKKIFQRILNKWDKTPFIPNRRFRIKIARLLVKYRLVGAHLLTRGAHTITANFSDAEANVSCYIMGIPNVCCADSGAHNSIISDETFHALNLDQNKLDKRQIFNIRTATNTEMDAVQGKITIPLTFQNAHNSLQQTIFQTFLVLRKDHLLTIPLLGTDFLRANQGIIKFNPDFVLTLNGQQIGKLDMNVGRTNTVLGETMPTQPTSTYTAGINPAKYHSLDRVNACYASVSGNYDPSRPNQTATLHEFNNFVGQNRLEKITYQVRKNKKYKNASLIDIHRVVTEQYDDEFANILQKHSMIPADDNTPDNPELIVDLNHLDDATKKQFNTIKNKYPKLYSTHKHQVGRFTGFEAKANIDPRINCRQKQRGRFLPQSAKDDLNKYFDSGVFQHSTVGVDKYACNITLTRRPQQKEAKYATRADKNLEKQKEKTEASEQTPPSTPAERVLYRLTIDMRSINSATRNDTTIVLPTIASIERNFHSCMITTLDIANQFYNVRLEEDSKKYFNFFVEESTWTHAALPQGWCASPKLAREAMIMTFGPTILRDFKLENTISDIDFPVMDFDKMLTQFVDDLAVYTPRTLPDNYTGKFTPVEYHLTALDSVLYALHRFGWLLSLRKSTILKDQFVYLGATWDMTEETIGINNDRLDSILSWREPRSLPEASSRLSSLMYYEDFSLYLKRLAYPLFVMVKRGIFIWGKAESHAWHNILFMMALSIKTAIFNPKYSLILLVDTSAVETAGFIMQWNPTTNQLVVLKAKSHLLTTAQRRASPIHREAQGTHHVMDSARPYLLQSEAKYNFLFVDASSISYISRVRPFENFLFELSCTLSEYPSLSVVHCPGRVLSAPDLLTRQLNDVILHRDDTNLSKDQANILPSLLDKLKPGTLISNQDLYEALNATPAAEYFDISEKNYLYSQRINWADYAKPDQLFSSEKEFIVAALLNHDETTLKLSTIKDVFAIKSSNSSFKTKAGKLQFLSQIRQKLKDLDYNSVELQRIQYFINQQENALDVPGKRKTIDTKYIVSKLATCQDCPDCTALPQQGIKTSIYDSVKFLDTIKPLVQMFNDVHFNKLFNDFSQLTCKRAKQSHAAYIIQQAIDACVEQTFSFEDTKLLLFSHHFVSETCSLDVEKDSIVIRMKEDLRLAATDIHHLDFILHTNTAIAPTITVNEEAHLMIAPHLLQDPSLHINGLSLYNMSTEENTVKKGTFLFSITFENIKSLLAVPVQPDKILRKASLHQNVLNFSFLDVLTKLLSKVGQQRLKEEKLDEVRYPTRVFDQNHALQENIQVSTASVAVVKGPQRKRKRKDVPNTIDNLDKNQEQRALNSVFLLQSLIKKDFGLKKGDIREMQLHDLTLAAEITRLEKTDDNHHGLRDNKFKLINGILYRMSPSDQLVLCVPPIVAESIATQLHNSNLFHYPADQLYDILVKLFYTTDLGPITKKIVQTCSVCILGRPRAVRKITGSRRTTVYLPGQCLCIDSCFLPKSSSGHTKLLILVDCCTSRISAYPSKSLTAAVAKAHIVNHILATGSPQVICSDHGSEFRKDLKDELAKINIQLQATTPYFKGTTAVAELSVKLIKRAMKKICLYDSRNWPENLPLVLDALNNSQLYNRTSRNQLHYSPFHYANQLNIMGMQDFPESLFDEQWKSLTHVLNTRQKNLDRTATKNPPLFRRHQLITDHHLPKTHTGDSQELDPSVQGVYRIKEVFPKRLRVVNVVDGVERTLPSELARPLNIEHLLNMKYSLQHQYLKSHFNRLMHNNRFIGPSEKKSWRHLIHSNAATEDVSPTRASENEDRVSEEDELEDPDQIKRTRSGKVYFTQTHPLKSILKVTSSGDKDQENIECLSPFELEAYKLGLRQSTGPLSQEQKEALKMSQGDLIYCSLKQWSQNSPKTGKKVILNQTTQVKEGTTITNQPWNQGKHEIDPEHEPTIRVNFVALDFSFKELFQ